MYVAVKGGQAAIENAHKLLRKKRRGNTEIAKLQVKQIQEQMSLAVDRVMNEGSLYDPELAALAISQSQGDLVEAAFLVRAYRTTLPRLGNTRVLDIENMILQRRISGTFKDIPGGQLLGPTYDYTQRLLDFSLLAEKSADKSAKSEYISESATASKPVRAPLVAELMANEGLMEEIPQDTTQQNKTGPADLTREPLAMPAPRSARLQNLARADEGFLLSLAYSVQRGFKDEDGHPFAQEIRTGQVEIELEPEELDFPITIGTITVTQCHMVTKNNGNGTTIKPCFLQGTGLVFGACERKAMSMALVDRSLRARELGERIVGPAQDEEFVLYHSDNIAGSGFVEHLKLPHYVDFQGELELIRRLQKEFTNSQIKTK